jgi:hypothetical protein
MLLLVLKVNHNVMQNLLLKPQYCLQDLYSYIDTPIRLGTILAGHTSFPKSDLSLKAVFLAGQAKNVYVLYIHHTWRFTIISLTFLLYLASS